MSLRCPYCHDRVFGVGPVCRRCGARHHAPCFREHGTCATCGGSARGGVRRVARRQPRERESFWEELPLLARPRALMVLSALLSFTSVSLILVSCHERELERSSAYEVESPEGKALPPAEAERLRARVAHLERLAASREEMLQERLALAQDVRGKAEAALASLAAQRRLLASLRAQREASTRSLGELKKRAERAEAALDRYRGANAKLRQELDSRPAQPPQEEPRTRAMPSYQLKFSRKSTSDDVETAPRQGARLAFWLTPALLQGPSEDAFAVAQAAAEDGEREAMLLLARLLARRGAQKQSHRWLERAARAGQPHAQFELGQSLVEDLATRQEGLGWIEQAAAAGLLDAQNELGVRLISLPEPFLDRALGEATLRRAAAAGHPLAMANLGALLASGRGERSELAEAKFWLRRAAKAGVPIAKTNLELLREALAHARR